MTNLTFVTAVNAGIKQAQRIGKDVLVVFEGHERVCKPNGKYTTPWGKK
jgi:hypothetical protein